MVELADATRFHGAWRWQERRQSLRRFEPFAGSFDPARNHRFGIRADLLNHGMRRLKVSAVHVWHVPTVAEARADAATPNFVQRNFRTLPDDNLQTRIAKRRMRC
jgi:hypothetical protein